MTRASEHGLQPLKERAPSDPDLALGARLLSHATPMPRSEARKRRVWNALSAGGGGRLRWRLSALHVAFASVLFAAVSSAAAGHYYVEHRAAAGRALLASRAEAKARPHGTVPRSHAARTEAASSMSEAALPAPVSAVVTDTEPLPTPRAPARFKPEPNSRTKPADADAQLLVEAMRARSAGDAKRVSELVAEYRAKHPQGVLQEEALILSVESAVARKAPNAGALAREYLSRYPSGRFAAQARRALTAETP